MVSLFISHDGIKWIWLKILQMKKKASPNEENGFFFFSSGTSSSALLLKMQLSNSNFELIFFFRFAFPEVCDGFWFLVFNDWKQSVLGVVHILRNDFLEHF